MGRTQARAIAVADGLRRPPEAAYLVRLAVRLIVAFARNQVNRASPATWRSAKGSLLFGGAKCRSWTHSVGLAPSFAALRKVHSPSLSACSSVVDIIRDLL